VIHEGRQQRMSFQAENKKQPGRPAWNRTKYSYDAIGNTTADGAHTYQYNDAGRLATVDGAAPIYQYDGENRRVKKVALQTTYYFYDPTGRLLTELIMTPEQGGGTGYGQDYVYLPDAPVARVDWAVVTNPDYHTCPPRAEFCPPPRIAISDLLYYHTDHLGTPIAMTNADAEFAWRAEYLPFGELFSMPIATVENNLRFPGQYFDAETGLHQNWFRDYSTSMGRYVEPDPLSLVDSGDSNPYRYARGNPVGLVDPMGLRVRVCCRPSVGRFDHCYIEEQTGGRRRTWALHNQNEDSIPWFYLLDPTPSCQLRRDDPTDQGGTCDIWREDDSREIAACVEDEFENYPIENYSAILSNIGIGSLRNSNTFTRCAAQACGLWVDPRVTASAPGYRQLCP